MMSKAFNRMVHLEKRKQLQPKFSKALTSIAELLNFGQDLLQIKKEITEEGYSSIELPDSVLNT
jgi:hypothetical protein